MGGVSQGCCYFCFHSTCTWTSPSSAGMMRFQFVQLAAVACGRGGLQGPDVQGLQRGDRPQKGRTPQHVPTTTKEGGERGGRGANQMLPERQGCQPSMGWKEWDEVAVVPRPIRGNAAGGVSKQVVSAEVTCGRARSQQRVAQSLAEHRRLPK